MAGTMSLLWSGEYATLGERVVRSAHISFRSGELQYSKGFVFDGGQVVSAGFLASDPLLVATVTETSFGNVA